MKHSFYKKALALAMAISLPVTVLSACGSKASSPKVQKPSSNSSKTNSSVENNDPFEKYNPPIDITFVRSIDDDLATNVLTKTPGETIENNRWLQLYKDQLGINVKYAWTVKGGYDSDAYKQKINATLASGDLPDVAAVNASQLKQLVAAGEIEDMTKYYKSYASPLTKQVYTQEGTSLLNSATFRGKLMGIPNADSDIEGAQFLWIRKDWLKKLKLLPPGNMDELLKISREFTTKDPDGNGKADTFGLAVTKDLYGGAMGLNGFFNGCHAYPTFWMENDSGKLVYGSIQPEMKTALKKLAGMYKAGQIDKDFDLKDGSKVAESIADGKVGIEFGEQWNPMYPLSSNYNNDPNADWIDIPLPSVDSNRVRIPLKFRTSMFFAVKKGYAHPEAVVKMINEYLEKNWGQSNEFNKYYMPNENGNVDVWKFSPVTPCPPEKNLDAFLAIDNARISNDMSKLEGEPLSIERNLQAYAFGDRSKWGWNKIFGGLSSECTLRQYKVGDVLMYEKYSGAPTDTMVEKKATLDKMENEEFIRIIMGTVPVDDFDKFVKDWNRLGGKQITKEVNDWYSSVKGK